MDTENQQTEMLDQASIQRCKRMTLIYAIAHDIVGSALSTHWSNKYLSTKEKKMDFTTAINNAITKAWMRK